MPAGGGDGSQVLTKSAELARSTAWPPASMVQVGDADFGVHVEFSAVEGMYLGFTVILVPP